MLRWIGATLALLCWCLTPPGARWLVYKFSTGLLETLNWVGQAYLLCLQDTLPDGRWRSPKLRTSRLPVTVELPPEVLVKIFDLLRRRTLYGLHRRSHHWWDTSTIRDSYRDLRRCQRVCRAWYGPATQALIAHVAPRTREKLLSFAEAQLQQQDQLPCVLGLHLPTVGVADYDNCTIDLTDHQQRQIQLITSWINSERAPQELSLSVDFSWLPAERRYMPWDDARVALLLSCTPRLRVLHLTGTFSCMIGELIRLDPRSTLLVSNSFSSLETLWLSKMTLEMYNIGPETFPHLRQLQLNDCHANQYFLQPFTSACPKLGELLLRDIMFSRPLTQQVAPSLPEIILHSTGRVTRLTLHNTQNLRLGDMQLFDSLRYLEISYLRIPRLRGRHWNDWSGAPPALEVFVVYMSNPHHDSSESCQMPNRLPYRPERKLWEEIGVLWKLMQTWKPLAPNLSQLELWNDVGPATWSSWQAIGLIFAVALERLDIHLSLHLKLCISQEIAYKEKFEKQRR